MSLTLALGATSYLYSKKVERDVKNLLEDGEYEELMETHQSSRNFRDVLPSDYSELGEKADLSLEKAVSATKGIAYDLALDEEILDEVYREFSKQIDPGEHRHYL